MPTEIKDDAHSQLGKATGHAFRPQLIQLSVAVGPPITICRTMGPHHVAVINQGGIDEYDSTSLPHWCRNIYSIRWPSLLFSTLQIEIAVPMFHVGFSPVLLALFLGPPRRMFGPLVREEGGTAQLCLGKGCRFSPTLPRIDPWH